MKRNVGLLLCMILTVVVFGQNQSQKEELESIQPVFTGIEKYVNIKDYLVNHVQYPEECAKCWLEGTEIVQFEVTAEGNVTNFNVINSVSSAIDNEIIRVLKDTDGMWKPGYNNGSPVAMMKEVSIVFKIAESEELEKRATRFFAKGNKHLLLKDNPHRALKYFEKGIALRPNEKCLLLARGLCQYKLGNQEEAQSDWKRIKTLGGIEADMYPVDYSDVEGYAELVRVMKEEIHE